MTSEGTSFVTDDGPNIHHALGISLILGRDDERHWVEFPVKNLAGVKKVRMIVTRAENLGGGYFRLEGILPSRRKANRSGTDDDKYDVVVDQFHFIKRTGRGALNTKLRDAAIERAIRYNSGIID